MINGSNREVEDYRPLHFIALKSWGVKLILGYV
jgi:subtilisin-like proprotein convertase family protein